MSDLIVVGFHGKHRAAEVLEHARPCGRREAPGDDSGVAAGRRIGVQRTV